MQDGMRIDDHKLIFHPDRVASWLATESDWKKAKSIYPIYMELSPFGGCNHRCSFCALDFVGYKARSLKIEMLRQKMPELGRLGVKSIMFGGEGEPLLHPDIIEMTQLIKKSGIDVALTTNGVKLNETYLASSLQYLSWIKVSFNAGTATNYAKVHGCSADDFHTVIANLKNAVRIRKQNNLACTIGAQIILLPETVDDIFKLATICRDEIGLDYLVVKPFSQNPLSTSKRYAELSYEHLNEIGDKTDEYCTKDFNLIFRRKTIEKHSKPKTYSKCQATPFFWAYIMANGDVYSCSAYLNDDRFRLGNINNKEFKAIWEGASRKSNYQLMLHEFNIDSCRQNCRMDSINAYLWQLKHPHPHVNFI